MYTLLNLLQVIQRYKYVQEPVAQLRVKELVTKFKKQQQTQTTWDNSFLKGRACWREEILFICPAIVKDETENYGLPRFQGFSKTILDSWYWLTGLIYLCN